VTCLLWGVAGAGLRAAIAVAENNPQLRVMPPSATTSPCIGPNLPTWTKPRAHNLPWVMSFGDPNGVGVDYFPVQVGYDVNQSFTWDVSGLLPQPSSVHFIRSCGQPDGVNLPGRSV
jgi:hypothetical protein